MAEAKLYGQNKGGMSINGIIKDYYAYAGEQISAGDLVEYINGVAGKTDCGTSADTQLSTESYTGYTISAVALDENRVFIVHCYNNISRSLYGMVVTINGATITCGTDTVLSSGTDKGNSISVCLLPDGSVFVAHNSTSNYYLYGIVVKIDGTTITAGADTSIRRSSYAGYMISTIALDNSRVLIIHSSGSGVYYLFGMVCTIDGTTITAGADTELSSTKYSGYAISTCLLPNGNVFIAHSYNTSYYLYGMVISISGTTITTGTDTALNNANTRTGEYISTVLLNNDSVFIAHSYSGNYYLYGMLVSIDGTTITTGADVALVTDSLAGTRISACLLPNGNVLVVHCYSVSPGYHIYGMVVAIDGATITAGLDTLMSDNEGAGYVVTSLSLDNGTVLVAHSYDASNYYLYAQIWGVDEANNILTNNIVATETETQVRKVTTGQFDGIAKTSGTGGDDTGHKDLISIWTKEG